MNTREEILARLAEASAQLLAIEPQSLVGYMIQRAVRLAQLPLPELMQVLVRDPNAFGQLKRDLGFEAPAGNAPGEETS